MHDINFIRNNPVFFDNALKSRNLDPCANQIKKIDEEKRNTQTILQNILAEKNNLSKEIGILKSKKEDTSSAVKKVEKLKYQISNLKELEKIKDDELKAILTRIPNIPAKDIPSGSNERDNVEYKQWGNKPKFEFKPKKHFEIGENLNLMNFNLASKISGSRFVVLKGMLSKLDSISVTSLSDKGESISILMDSA